MRSSQLTRTNVMNVSGQLFFLVRVCLKWGSSPLCPRGKCYSRLEPSIAFASFSELTEESSHTESTMVKGWSAAQRVRKRVRSERTASTFATGFATRFPLRPLGTLGPHSNSDIYIRQAFQRDLPPTCTFLCSLEQDHM